MKHFRKAFSFLSLVVLLALLTSLAGVIFVLQKRVGVAPRASSSTESAEELFPATPSKLGLKITPTLNAEFGKLDIQVSWRANLASLAHSGESLDKFRVTVRKMPFNTYPNLISSGFQALVDKDSTSKTFVGLAVPSNGDYFVQLRAIYKSGSSKSRVLVDRKVFTVVEDNFAEGVIKEHWVISSDHKDEVFVSNGELVFKENTGYSTKGLHAWAQLKPSISDKENLHVRVDYIEFPWTFNDRYVYQGLYLPTDPTPKYAHNPDSVYINAQNDTSGDGINGNFTYRKGASKTFFGNQTPENGFFSIKYDHDKNVDLSYGDSSQQWTLGSAVDRQNLQGNSIALVVNTLPAYTGVTKFDNFRAVWVQK